ncbi:hypothetical protein [Sulfobacillus thermosulfidooxidans]|uniref:hypothetical protein n=1 Tax=Sulfobacillus thermosulfidooxidans TaxID=28034 RepID=UPI0006B5E634|nr:hypothetical protein [Sulfobacillus thermosulfidooxidans]
MQILDPIEMSESYRDPWHLDDYVCVGEWGLGTSCRPEMDDVVSLYRHRTDPCQYVYDTDEYAYRFHVDDPQASPVAVRDALWHAFWPDPALGHHPHQFVERDHD